MEKLSSICILFLTLGIALGSLQEKDTRHKRDVFEDFKTSAMLTASEINNKFQEGVGFHDNSDREFNFFGAKIGGGHNFKTGFGDAVNDPEPDSMERRKRDVVIYDEDDYNTHGRYDNRDDSEGDTIVIVNERKKREADTYDMSSSSESGEITSEDVNEERRRKRNAMRSYTMNRQESGESSSEESFQTTTPGIEMSRKKRAAKPCYGRKGGMQPAPGGGTGGGGGDTGGGEVEQLRSAKYRRGKRQAPETPDDSYIGHVPKPPKPSFGQSSGDPDDKFQMFMQQMMESVQRVVQIAGKVREAFEQQPTGHQNYPE